MVRHDDIHTLVRKGFLEMLLADRTTGHNIVWETETYKELGISKTDVITSDVLCAHVRELGEIYIDKRIERTG